MFLPDIEQVPDAIDIEEDNCSYSTVVPIAHCVDTGRIVSVDCTLDYTTNIHSQPLSGWFHEFSFSITCASLEVGGNVFSTQDRNIAKNYIPEQIRGLVMPIVLESCAALIMRVRPRALYRVTKMRRPTPRALAKHDLITVRLRDLGYSLYESGTDAFGRTFWVMAYV